MWRQLPAIVIVLAAVMAGLGSSARLAAQVEVPIDVAADPSSDVPLEILVVAEPGGGSAAGASEGAVDFLVEPGRWMLDLPAAGRWRLQAQAPGYWGNEVEVEGGAVGEVIELRLWRAGSLRGALSTTADEGLPSQVQLHLEGDFLTSDAGEPRAVSINCPVVEGVWQCEVPVSRLDLVLTADRFVSHHRRKVIVEPDTVRDLGTFELELGGSIGGRVELEGGGSPSRECEIRLEIPVRAGRGDRQTAALGTVEEDGSFEFEGIPAGKYLLTASQPSHIDVTSDTIRLSPGQSARIPEPLVLRRPAALELVFSPPVGPEGRSWTFTIKALDSGDSRPATAVRGESGPDGTWSREDLVAGTYELEVSGGVGAGPIQRKIELPSGWTSLLMELPLVMVEGYVQAGGEPLAAKVTFGQGEGKPGTGFSADDSGSFSGILPREGLWQVKVEAPEEGINLSLDGIEVWAQGGSGVAVVEIRLPGTVLEGEVTDMLGSPIAGATVSVRRSGQTGETRNRETDVEGWFRILGLEPGAVSVMATAGELQSQSLDVILYEDRPGPALRIVVR